MLLCYVTNRHLLHHEANASKLLLPIRTAILAGVDWVQIREKDCGAKALLGVTREAAEFARSQTRTDSDPLFKIIVNDRLDVALAAGAAGVHLGSASIPTAEVARWRKAGNSPRDFLIGVSCHSAADVEAAESAGADYVFLGPIFETPSKLQFGSPLGLDVLAEAVRRVRIPVLAIGGISENNAKSCREAGATGIAAIRLFQTAEDASLAECVARLRAQP